MFMTNNFVLPALLRYLTRRLTAYLIDSLVLFVGVLVTQGIIYALGLNPIANRLALGESFAGWQLHLWVFATVSVPFWIYYASLHSSVWQATLGKRLMGLRAMTTMGERIRFPRALLRAIVMLIPFEWNHVVIMQLAPQGPSTPTPLFWMGYALTWVLIVLYLGLLFFNLHRQSVHDVATQTYVSEA